MSQFNTAGVAISELADRQLREQRKSSQSNQLNDIARVNPLTNLQAANQTPLQIIGQQFPGLGNVERISPQGAEFIMALLPQAIQEQHRRRRNAAAGAFFASGNIEDYFARGGDIQGLENVLAADQLLNPAKVSEFQSKQDVIDAVLSNRISASAGNLIIKNQFSDDESELDLTALMNLYVNNPSNDLRNFLRVVGKIPQDVMENLDAQAGFHPADDKTKLGKETEEAMRDSDLISSLSYIANSEETNPFLKAAAQALLENKAVEIGTDSLELQAVALAHGGRDENIINVLQSDMSDSDKRRAISDVVNAKGGRLAVDPVVDIVLNEYVKQQQGDTAQEIAESQLAADITAAGLEKTVGRISDAGFMQSLRMGSAGFIPSLNELFNLGSAGKELLGSKLTGVSPDLTPEEMNTLSNLSQLIVTQPSAGQSFNDIRGPRSPQGSLINIPQDDVSATLDLILRQIEGQKPNNQ